MAIQLSTAGVKVYYAVETTKGTRPTASWTQLKEIKSVPELNPEPNNLQTTNLEEPEWHTYIPGLKSLGGALPFLANLTEESMAAWEDLVEAYETGASTGLSTWFVVVIPGLTKSLYFAGQPSPMGMPGMEVDSVLEVNFYVSPTGAPKWDAKPTIA
jgi:hypothetical protein